jgi:integrase
LGRVEKFLSIYQSKNTINSYRYALKEFFKTIYEKNEKNLDECAEIYFGEKRKYEDDLYSFLKNLEGKPPKTIRLMISAVKSFLIKNDVEIPQRFWRRLSRKIKGSRARTIDHVPSNIELRRLLMHMPIHGKTLFLMLATSGMRIGEALQLTLDDVDLNTDPVKISIRGEYTKTGNPRITYISNETKETLEEWLKNREKYISFASKKSVRYQKSTNDPHLFPFQNNTAYMIWRNALRDAKLSKKDNSTNRQKIHPHVLRKFFRTKMGSMIPVDVTEALMGHEGYLTEVYRKYSVEKLAEFYSQGESAISIFAGTEQISKLRTEVDEKSQQLQTIINV